MIEYTIIEPPFNLKFNIMSKKELDDFFKWYLDQIPNRILIIEKVVKCTQGFESWQADFTPESLDVLGEWFANQIETRKFTEEEIQEKRACFRWPISELPVPNWELTDRTFSLAVDIGMYLSQVILKNIPGLKWEYKTKGSKRWIEYGQPVISGLGWRAFNPTRIVVSLAYSFAKKTEEYSELRQVFEYIKKHVSE